MLDINRQFIQVTGPRARCFPFILKLLSEDRELEGIKRRKLEKMMRKPRGKACKPGSTPLLTLISDKAVLDADKPVLVARAALLSGHLTSI